MGKLITKQNGLSADAASYIADALSENTRRGYAADLRDWKEWCRSSGASESNPTAMQVTNYLAFLAKAGAKHSTITRRRAAIRRALRVAAVARNDAAFVDPTDDPHVRSVLQGVARRHGTRPYQKQALTIEELERVVALMGDALGDIRDRAMLCMQFACAQRGGELLALKVEDIEVTAGGMTVLIESSKTDQQHKGETIDVPRTGGSLCPVTAYQAWLGASGIRSGYVFRRIYKNCVIGETHLTHRSLSSVVKMRTAAAGLKGDYSGHSARRGFVTSATDRGLTDGEIMRVTRHRSVQTMHGYRQVDASRQRTTIAAVMG